MSAIPSVRCESCGTHADDPFALAGCRSCGGTLAVSHEPPRLRGAALRELFDSRRGAPDASGPEATSGVWRFRELILDADPPGIVTLGEGRTPLIASDAIRRFTGVDSISVKHEGLNPTGSFKDRGMTVAITHARLVGARAVLCASTGNTSSSLAAYAAHAGIPAVVLIPLGKVSPGKMAQTMAYGARTLLVRGDFDDCMRLAREAATRLKAYLANSLNPWRIQGQKTIMLDLLQQCAWKAPDWVALPAGNLGNTAAFGRALVQARELGLIDRIPRLLCVQALGAAPFAKSFASGFAQRERVKAETVASAIRIGDPASWDRAVLSIRATDGVVTAVTDDAILAAQAEISRAGIGCEPASAASVAGVRAMREQGVIARDHRVVAVLTGHLLKDPSAAAADSLTLEVDATVESIERALP